MSNSHCRQLRQDISFTTLVFYVPSTCMLLAGIEVSYCSFCMLGIDLNLEFKSCLACIAKIQVKITALLTAGLRTNYISVLGNQHIFILGSLCWRQEPQGELCLSLGSCIRAEALTPGPTWAALQQPCVCPVTDPSPNRDFSWPQTQLITIQHAWPARGRSWPWLFSRPDHSHILLTWHPGLTLNLTHDHTFLMIQAPGWSWLPLWLPCLSSPHTVGLSLPSLTLLCLVSLPLGNNLPFPPPNNAIHIFLRGCCISQLKCLSQSKNSLPPKGGHPLTSPSLLHPAFSCYFQPSHASCSPCHSTHWCSVRIINKLLQRRGKGSCSQWVCEGQEEGIGTLSPFADSELLHWLAPVASLSISLFHSTPKSSICLQLTSNSQICKPSSATIKIFKKTHLCFKYNCSWKWLANMLFSPSCSP